MDVLSVVGARPQFIKAAAVSRTLRNEHEELLVHTGQHYDETLSDVFFDELGIPEPDHNLGVGSASHGQQTADMLVGLEELLDEHDPDVVLLYGDTNSTLAGALAGAKSSSRVAHVEAGLRSHNWSMPEEVNRVLTDHASDLLFAPSETAVENLHSEGITDGVCFTGDVMYDAILWASDVAADRSSILADLDVVPNEYILATVHRAGNTDDPDRLERLVSALSDAPLPVIFPVHPRTEKRLQEFDLYELASENLRIIEPVGYLDFIRLLDGAERVATDSGGVQKEAFFLDTPCITLREETEWVETVDAGWNVLAGADRDAIGSALRAEFGPARPKPTPYGDGNAAENIINCLPSESR